MTHTEAHRLPRWVAWGGQQCPAVGSRARLLTALCGPHPCPSEPGSGHCPHFHRSPEACRGALRRTTAPLLATESGDLGRSRAQAPGSGCEQPQLAACGGEGRPGDSCPSRWECEAWHRWPWGPHLEAPQEHGREAARPQTALARGTLPLA